MSSSSALNVGSFVHGAITAVETNGLVVDFQRHQGFVAARETGLPHGARLDHYFSVLDEVDAWVLTLRRGAPVELTLCGEPDPANPSPAVAPVEPQPTTRLPGVRPGEGVPFWELYMRRRTTRSWSKGQS